MSFEFRGEKAFYFSSETPRPTTPEKPIDKIPFVGFTEKQKKWLTGLVEIFGFPLEYVKKIELSKDETFSLSNGKKTFLGRTRIASVTAGVYNTKTGTLIIHPRSVVFMNKSLKKGWKKDLQFDLPTNIVHELTHACSATLTHQKITNPSGRPNIQPGYGELLFSDEQAEHFSKKVEALADLSLKTNRFFNRYHKDLSLAYASKEEQEYVASETNLGPHFLRNRMISELEAILVELYFGNPKKLKQLEGVHLKKLTEVEKTTYTSPTALVEELLMHTTKRSLEEVRASQAAYKKYVHGSRFPL